MPRVLAFFFALAAGIAALSWNLSTQGHDLSASSGRGGPEPLISDTTTMQTAWDLVMNPLTDSLPGDRHLAEEIKEGFLMFTDTPHRAPRLSGNGMTCGNCHLNAGQRSRALPLVGIAGAFPEYNKRAGRLFSLEDRIVDCFNRSMNSAGRQSDSGAAPTTQSREVLAIASYLSWLSKGSPLGASIPWRGRNAIPPTNLIPVRMLDTAAGGALFRDRCVNCHGEDGQGVWIGDKKAGPLWGPESWNDGAGAARVYTLAGIIRYSMPYINPGSLTDEEAQQIAAFITSQPRPRYPFKAEDYRTEQLPPDAVYYPR